MTEGTHAKSGKKKGGCCGIGCLVLILVPLLTGAGLYLFGQDWVRSQIAERMGLPVISGGTIVVSEAAGGSADPADFPAHVFVPAGAVRSVYKSNEAEALAVVVLKDTSATRVARQAKKGMKRHGWKFARRQRMHDGEILEFKRRKERATIGIYPHTDRLEVWAHWSASPPAEVTPKK